MGARYVYPETMDRGENRETRILSQQYSYT